MCPRIRWQPEGGRSVLLYVGYLYAGNPAPPGSEAAVADLFAARYQGAITREDHDEVLAAVAALTF